MGVKAIVYDRFGSVAELRCEEIEVPSPGEGEILVKVHAASVNPLDWHMLRGKPWIIRLSPDVRGKKPMRPGRDVAGTIEKVGKNVRNFSPGDQVFGAAQGAFAEYVCAPAAAFLPKPAGISFDEAAATPIGGLTALQALRDAGQLRAGMKVLINGAAGGVGTFAVQIAKTLNAHVTAVCSGNSASLVLRLGADEVVDYEREDFTRRAETYDLIVDLIGNIPYGRLKRLLAPQGRIAAVGGGAGGVYALGRWMLRTLAAAVTSRATRQKVVFTMSRLDLQDLAYLGDLIASGAVTPVIDRRFRLAEAPDAMRHLAGGHVHGKVVIVV